MLNSKKWHTQLFLLCLLIFFVTPLSAQIPCPPVSGQRTTNPTFPGCLPPGSSTFNVLLVLDESGSIGQAPAGFEDEMENAVRAFANTLSGNVGGPGEMRLGIVEFSSGASIPLGLKDVKDANFIETVEKYLNGENTGQPVNYNPGGFTNYIDALTKVATIPGLDIVFFISDGNPEPPQNSNTWMGLANNLKCAGTYIFGIGLGSNIIPLNIQLLSGPDQLGNPLNLPGGADWTVQSFANLPASLVELANSQIDRQAPNVNCPPNMRVSNDPGICGKIVPFTPQASDNCGISSVVCTPASGGFFAVGQTTVTCKATDNVGNTSTCAFIITVNDLESPAVACPGTVTVSCEASMDPADTGTPVSLDNCGIGQVAHADVRINGGCMNEFTLQRTWTVTDIHGNFSICTQTIHVIDQTSPALTCPPNITVTCDTTAGPSAGFAIVKDNCDPAPALSRSDQVIGGDCAWLCIIERTWQTADACGNTAKCVQTVTKNTLPLLEQALNKDLNGDGKTDTLVLGVSNSTLAIPPGRGNCIQQWLPSLGTQPSGLKFKNGVTGADCKPGENPVAENGKLANPLLAEALKLHIMVRLKPVLGTTKLNTLGCTIAPIVLQALAPNPDVNELLRVTNAALGNIALQPHLKELLDALKCINGPLDVCK